jgi:hypothetical protein
MRTNVDLIKQTIVDGDIEGALKTLDTTLQNSEYGDSVVILQSRVNRLKKNKSLGQVTDDDFDIENNKIIKSILDLLKFIKSDFISKEIKFEPELYLFESPYETTTPYADRVYAKSFENSKTRSIGFELRGAFPVLFFPVKIGIKWRTLNPANVYSADYFADYTLQETWTTCWLNRLWGYKEAGKWKTGNYTIEVYIDDDLKGKGTFTIK